MPHLPQNAVCPPAGPRASVEDWGRISWFLREAPRKRHLQMEKMRTEALLLS